MPESFCIITSVIIRLAQNTKVRAYLIPASLQLCILLRCWNLHGFSFFHAQFKCRMLVPRGHHLSMNAGCFCIYKSNQNSSMILEQIFLIPECLGGVDIFSLSLRDLILNVFAFLGARWNLCFSVGVQSCWSVLTTIFLGLSYVGMVQKEGRRP